MIEETVEFLNSQTDNFTPEIALVLGSGLGCFCEGLEGRTVKYDIIPHFGRSSVKGHRGELLFCNIKNTPAVIAQGRFHYYEGYPMSKVTYPIRVFKKLGAKTLVLTNAAGAINKDFNIGDIMIIKDHINFMGDNPLIGKNDDSEGERFPDMSNCYDKNLQKAAKDAADKLNIDIKSGVYLATSGPNYETAAEIRAFRALGADVVGMSTVPEAIMANYLKMKTLAFSLITNYATGVSDQKLNHEEVLQIGASSSKKLANIIESIIKGQALQS